MLASSRPFWPLFLHVLGAMALFGAILAATILSLVGGRRTDLVFLRTATFRALLAALPPYVVFRVAARWLSDNEGFTGRRDPAWITIGLDVADGGTLLLLATLGCAYWWLRGGPPLAGRIVAGLSSAYLVLLAVAWLAMTGKWN
jgi:hypothetical protein